MLLHQFDQTHTRCLRIAGLRQRHHRRCHHRALVVLAEAQILQAQDFALVHLNATVDLPEVFTKGDLVDQLFHLTKLTLS